MAHAQWASPKNCAESLVIVDAPCLNIELFMREEIPEKGVSSFPGSFYTETSRRVLALLTYFTTCSANGTPHCLKGSRDSYVGVTVFTRPSNGARVDLLPLSMRVGRAAEDEERDQCCYAKWGDDNSHRNGGSGAAEANQWRSYGTN
jgi:hypothetical protein